MGKIDHCGSTGKNAFAAVHDRYFLGWPATGSSLTIHAVSSFIGSDKWRSVSNTVVLPIKKMQKVNIGGMNVLLVSFK